jgi:flagellar motor switch protein FliN/FliY
VRGFANAIGNVQGEAIEVESCATLLGPLNLPPVFALSEGAVQAQFSINIPGLESLDATLLFTPDLARALLSIAVEVEEGASGEESELTTVGSEPAGGGETPGLDGLSLLPSFDPNHDEDLPKGISLLLDIPLEVTVELGRVRMLIRDVLELGAGSIVELDRVAGEPVDLLVNGKLIAKGEVVVIEDNFGIRVTEILSPAERVTSLGKAS